MRLWKAIKNSYSGDFKPLWMSISAMLIANALDLLISFVCDVYMPPWSEANPFARDPFNHKLITSAALFLHAEFYLILYLPMGYLIYKGLRCYFTKRFSAFLISFYPWYIAFTAMKEGVLTNAAMLLYYLLWYRHLAPL
jgi:hypothetical protein